jgi:DNA primase
MTLNQEFLRTLKDKLNIVDVAGSYLSLEKKGANYWACCPFHHEKTPSFSINEADQFYHCFGCGASGDVIKFVSEIENLDFMETVKELAARAGVPLPEAEIDSEKSFEKKRKRDTLLKLMNDTAHFYLDNLYSGKADAHIAYILKREISSPIVRAFGLGASLNYNDLPRFLAAKGYSKQDMLDSGVVSEADGRLFDSLAGRLIFPIINAMGDVIAFGGRELKKVDFGKYKNTKETVIFSKGHNLYNINQLKKLKRNQTIKNVIMVEGYMDTISLYEAGFKNVVASMGTSLTQDQARLIKRYTDTVLISYDGDGAGQKANIRGLDILQGEGINVKVVPLPEGLDPDEVIKQRGAEAYQQCLDNAMPLIDFKLLYLKRGFDLTKPEEKRKYVSDAIKIIRTSDNAAEQEDLLKELRDQTGITFEALNRELLSKPREQEVEKEKPPTRKDESSMPVKASRFVLASYLFGAKYTKDAESIENIEFVLDVHTVIARYLVAKKVLEEPVRISEVFELFDENSPEMKELSYIFDLNDGDSLQGEVAEKFFNDCLKQLRYYQIDVEISEIKARIGKVTELAERKELTIRLQELITAKGKIERGSIQ